MQLCDWCGLRCLGERMTADAYRDFYASGMYRKLVSAYHGREINAETMQAEQEQYAGALAERLEPFVMPLGGPWHRLLDIGGSTGVAAVAMCTRFGLLGTVIDPAIHETDAAIGQGLIVCRGTIDDLVPSAQRFDVVLMCQTVDHLLDIAGALRKVHDLLTPQGIFFVDIVDYRCMDASEAVKIDHPYYLTPDTMRLYLRKAGLKVLQQTDAEDGVHVQFVCRRAK